MLLLELAAQGVKGLSSGAWSVRLGRGYNVIAADGAALRGLLEALFDAVPPDGAEALGRGAVGAQVRAGATVLGDDRNTYRIMRELGPGNGWQLQRLDPGRQAFLPLSTEPAAIEATLRGAVGVPEPLRRRLLTVSIGAPAARADRGAPIAGVSTGARPERPAPVAPPIPRPSPAELERAEATRKRVEDLRRRVSELTDRVQQGVRLRAELARADEALGAFGSSLGGSEIPEARAALAACEVAAARRDRALGALEAERVAIADLPAGSPRPFWTLPAFWAGVVVGCAAVASAALLARIDGARYLALLDVPAFGWSAWLALRWVGAREEHERAARRRRRLEEREREIGETFERESAPARRVMAALGVTREGELGPRLDRLEEASAAERAARDRLAAFEAGAPVAADTELERLESELRDAEDEATAEAGGWWAAGPPLAPATLGLPAEIARPAASPGPPPPGDGDGDGDERARALLRRAGELLDPGAPAAAALMVRSGELAGLLSAGRLAGLSLGDASGLAVRAGEQVVALAVLPAADRELVHAAIALAVVERGLGKLGPVAVVDSALDALPEAGRRASAQVLRELGRKGQLLHATREAIFREAADQVAAPKA